MISEPDDLIAFTAAKFESPTVRQLTHQCTHRGVNA